jgi:hypothetical protein
MSSFTTPAMIDCLFLGHTDQQIWRHWHFLIAKWNKMTKCTQMENVVECEEIIFEKCLPEHDVD